jgi:hypothetical protein
MSSLPPNSDSDPVLGSRPVLESTPAANGQPRGLRIARWCAAVPAALGLTASLGWLASGGLIAEVGWFYSLGLLAIGLGCVLLPVGLLSTIRAWWQGARQTSVLVALLLLLANLPLAAGCWGLASWVLDLHVVRISNNSTREIGPVRVWIEVPPGMCWRFPRSVPGNRGSGRSIEGAKGRRRFAPKRENAPGKPHPRNTCSWASGNQPKSDCCSCRRSRTASKGNWPAAGGGSMDSGPESPNRTGRETGVACRA